MAEDDFAGLLEGLEGDAREGRRRLLESLSERGVALEELRRAVAEDRLPLVPVELELRGDARMSGNDVAAASGLEQELLAAVQRSIGLPVADPDEPGVYGESSLENAKRLKQMLDAGVPLEGMLDVTRVMGRSMAQVAAAMRMLVGDAFLEAGDCEDQAAERLVFAARALMPMLAPTLEHMFGQHLLQLIRSDFLSAAELETGRVTALRPVAVGFADLVGFTRLGGQVPPEDLGHVARRLETLAAERVEPPVRVVKSIGDAVMVASKDAGTALEFALDLLDAVEGEGEGFPQLRCGLTWGTAVERDGDLFGHPVNVASRITDFARPGSVLVSEEVREAAGDDYDWSFAGARRLRGIPSEVKLFRARRPAPAG